MNNQGPSVPHGNLPEYVKGFIYSAILTSIAFLLVIFNNFDALLIKAVLIILALFQLITQLKYFLHMKTTEDQSWNIVTGAFTVIQVLILVIGTMWIMMHLNHNMQIGF